ncbi:hypothetical protein ACH414_31670 [Streptomyces sp. NPDC020422]|uniref:hypothetical protein n=1 Tax=Streptomyces sp. NPDC020422 TaxID=3365074 RepID=UPI0037B62C60
MRTRLAAAAATLAVSAGMLVATPAAGADVPDSQFDVYYGQTYTWGSIKWYNRSVVVEGTHKSVSPTSCRGTTVYTLDSQGRQLSVSWSMYAVCGDSARFTMTVPADVPGGAAFVRVCLDNGRTDPPITALACKRYGRP